MNKNILAFAVLFTTITGFVSCGPKCKTCHVEIMGVKSPEQEMCGDQLKQAEKTSGMLCK